MRCYFPKRVVPFLFLCAPALLGARGQKEKTFTVAEQFGLAYAPLQVMARMGYLEEMEPDWEIRWVRLGNTAAIWEGVLSGRVDAGFLGIPPFLISRDRGLEWKIIGGLSQSPLGLVVRDDPSLTLASLGIRHRIALPQPGSIQHILLAMFLDREFGDPSRLDSSLVSLNHPDGMTALLSGSLDGHFTSPPFLFEETEQEGFSLLLTGEEAMGEPFTFIVGAVTEDFYQRNRAFCRSYGKALDRAIDFINTHPDETVALLAPLYSLEEERLYDYLYRRGMVFEREVRGLDRFIKFMEDQGMITGRIEAEELFL